VFQSPGEIFLTLTIRWYGVMIALGFLLASIAATRLAKKMNISPERLINCGLITFLGGVLGARLYFVALSWSYFQIHPFDIFATWKGGLSIHGGIIGGTIAGWLYCKKEKLPVLRYADVIASVLPLAQAIGRWGNFFNSEAFGRPVADDYPLRLFIPQEKRPQLYINNNYFHPTFLYESAWDLVLYLLLYFVLAEKLKKYPGMTFMSYLAGYSLGRLWIEPLRVDSIMVAGAQAPFVVSAAMLIFSMISLLIILRVNKGSSQ
jgi:phosphatidylglycerol---prolipoprotein diacylglyceryl transferase